ncbi:dihydrofolate reductase family protein [Actinomadura sp. NPDC049753]|uniref:dihydrofolate reductase family protein n=1 Tax=Actinomadura sp. NPDC049753 TaxID=3154739 RepID=UPI0034171353
MKAPHAPEPLDSGIVTTPSRTRRRGDATAAIRELKKSSSGEIQVHGSATLIRSLLAASLVDELTLLVVPVLLGQGVHVYRPAGQPEYHPARPT